MADLPFESPAFQTQLDECEVWLETLMAEHRASFCDLYGFAPEAVFANMANMLLMAGERLVAGYIAKRAARKALAHDAYSTGIRKAPRRETAQERAIREAKALGMYRGAA